MPPAATNFDHILTLPDHLGHGMSVKCEQPIDELTVQVWLLYDHPNFKYCTLFVSGMELRTNRQTDDPNTRCPQRTFQAGGIKTGNTFFFHFRYLHFYMRKVWFSQHWLWRCNGNFHTSRNITFSHAKTCRLCIKHVLIFFLNLGTGRII